MYDAEGSHDGTRCPNCGETKRTVRWSFAEGFDELECRACGFRSDEDALRDLKRDALDTLQADADLVPPTVRPLRA